MLMAASTAPPWPGPGALSPHASIAATGSRTNRGEPAMGREVSRRDLVFGWVRLDPDHEAAIRFKGEAPGRRAHSVGGLATMAHLVTPPPRIVINGRAQRRDRSPKLCLFSAARSGRCELPQLHPHRHDACSGHAPERDQQFPGEGHDHGGLACALGAFRARSIPPRQCAVFWNSGTAKRVGSALVAPDYCRT